MRADTDASEVRPTRFERLAARRRRWARPVLAIGAVSALAAGLRFYHLSSPHAFVFDEVYYAKDGCFDAGFPYRRCQLERPGEQTVTAHPPLGRWIIAGGVAALSRPSDFGCVFGEERRGCHPFGFRAAAAAFGTLSVLLTAVLGWRLFRSALWAGVAGLLLATEGLHFVQSRVAMLDIFVATFGVAGFLFLVLDREWIERRTPPPPEPSPEERREALLLGLPSDGVPAPTLRPWRAAAGLAFGAAVATKWSGGLALLGGLILALAWERSRRAAAGVSRPLGEAIREESFGLFLFLVLVPLGAYVASYAPWFADHGADLKGWWDLQLGMARFSIRLRSPHTYSSRPWSWLLMVRPVLYYYQCFAAGGEDCARASAIIGLGNPVVFWGSLVSLPYVLYGWAGRRDWRAGLVAVAFAAQYVPWFFAARTSFFFYMTPATPFLALAGTYALRDLASVRVGADRVRSLAPVAGFVVLASVAVFAFFLPVLTGRVISFQAWQMRMWLRTWI